MALTPDQKEAIMASRGQSAQPASDAPKRNYLVTFADGSRAYAIDMNGDTPEEFVRGVRTINDSWAGAKIEPA